MHTLSSQVPNFVVDSWLEAGGAHFVLAFVFVFGVGEGVHTLSSQVPNFVVDSWLETGGAHFVLIFVFLGWGGGAHFVFIFFLDS